MTKITSEQLLTLWRAKGYELKGLPYQMNIFGIRNSNSQADTFDDIVGLLYKDEKGNWQIRQYAATTDPGAYYRLNPMNVDGTAIIIPMQHKNCYKVGLHKGYKAMQQIAPMAYVRDNNKDKILDFAYKIVGFKSYRQIGATNIHHAINSGVSAVNYNWSAGCQVIADIKDFNEFMAIVEEGVNHYKFSNTFDYTLFESNEIK